MPAGHLLPIKGRSYDLLDLITLGKKRLIVSLGVRGSNV